MNIFDQLILNETLINELDLSGLTPEQKSQFRQEVKKNHPDNGGSEEKIKQTYAKYQKISDDNKRQKTNPNPTAGSTASAGSANHTNVNQSASTTTNNTNNQQNPQTDTSGKGRGAINNLSVIGSKISSLAANNPKLLIVLVNGIIIAITAAAAYKYGYNQGKEDASKGLTNKLITAALGGALALGVLQLGFKLVKHVCTKSAAEVAASNKPKDQKLKILNGLLSAAQKSVLKAKNASDKELAQASVDIIQKYINNVQAQAA